MDNLTHSLIGAAVAEAAFQLRKKRESTVQRAPLYSASILANNFPDLDLLYRIFEPGNLTYLLNHRGWTHSFLFSIPQGTLILFAFWLWQTWRGTRWSAATWRALLAVTALGLCLHLGLDFLNSYGIHPLSPFDNHWYFGDTIFIVEPWLWVFLIPLALLSLPRRTKGSAVVAALMVSVFCGGLCVGVRAGMVPLGLAVLIGGTGAGFFLVLQKAQAAVRPWIVIAALTSVIGVFRAGHDFAHAGLERAFHPGNSHLTLADLVLSPLPGNPFCWTFFAVEKGAESYRVDTGVVDLMRTRCARGLVLDGKKLDRSPCYFCSDLDIREYGGYAIKAAELVAQYKTHCRVRAWFQYARVPYREGTEYGDLRFALKGSRNFSSYDSARNPPDECMSYPVPWLPPRSDFLEPSI